MGEKMAEQTALDRLKEACPDDCRPSRRDEDGGWVHHLAEVLPADVFEVCRLIDPSLAKLHKRALLAKAQIDERKGDKVAALALGSAPHHDHRGSVLINAVDLQHLIRRADGLPAAVVQVPSPPEPPAVVQVPSAPQPVLSEAA
jgi:hypothetical protein